MEINIDKLHDYCQKSIKKFRKLGKTTKTRDGCYVHIDQGASVLGVAHLDVANTNNHFGSIKIQNKLHVISPRLDDRLGVYLLLDYLPQLGVKCDVLLTEGEEVGNSTGAHFKLPKGKEYNWMFQFDRRGDGAVLYSYDCAEMREKLKKHDIETQIGSFSDISSMQHLGIKGINFGCGYHQEHTDWCYANLDVTKLQAAKFQRFYKENRDTKFKHEQVVTTSYRSAWSSAWDGNYGYTSSYGGYHGYDARDYSWKRGSVWSDKCWGCGCDLPRSKHTLYGGEVCDDCDDILSDQKNSKDFESVDHFQDIDGLCACGDAGCEHSDLELWQKINEAKDYERTRELANLTAIKQIASKK